MKKNGNYVGVDEKFIPENEKYVDEPIIGSSDGLKDGIRKGSDQVANYVTDKDNQEKFKKAGRKGFKIIKGIGIGYLVFWAIIILLTLSVFIFTIFAMIGTNKKFDNISNTINEKFKTNEQDEKSNETDKNTFNFPFKNYSGVKKGIFIKNLLDEVIASNNANKDYAITVIFGETKTSNNDEIRALKDQLEELTEYEVTLDYDSNGYIAKITVSI